MGDSQQWQDLVAGIDAQYPLIEGTQITDWAWAVYDAATAEGLLNPLLLPGHAVHYDDGIWVISYQGNLDDEGENYVTRGVLISDADGHVIHVE